MSAPGVTWPPIRTTVLRGILQQFPGKPLFNRTLGVGARPSKLIKGKDVLPPEFT